MATPKSIALDFDRIALLSGDDAFDNNVFYHRMLLRQIAEGQTAIDMGCGTGQFSRLLASRFKSVVGLDLSANMVAVARQRSVGFPNLQFRQADVSEWDWPREHFDCIVSIATLHHLPLAETLRRMKEALKPGGTLLVLDLRRNTGLVQRLMDFAALPLSLWLRWRHTGRLREPQESRQRWAEHARTDRYSSLEEVREAAETLLPGVTVQSLLLWRYTLVWRKPAVTPVDKP